MRRRDFLFTATAPLWAAGPVSIDLGRQLFVDDYLIEANTLERSFQKPKTHPASPVLKPETAVEMNHGVMPAAAPFSDGVCYDPRTVSTRCGTSPATTTDSATPPARTAFTGSAPVWTWFRAP